MEIYFFEGLTEWNDWSDKMGRLIDMTGWVMSEHGVPDSRLKIIKYVGNNKWLAECNCESHTQFEVLGSSARSGNTKSCGCLFKETLDRTHQGKKIGNKYDLSGNYGIGWTSNTNKEFYFDLEDYDKIKKHTWMEVIHNNYSVLMTGDKTDGNHLRMTEVLGFVWYDHENRNTLDNRKCNLRPATEAENSRNRSLQSNNTSGITGLSWFKETSQWMAYITVDDDHKFLGLYNNKQDAITTRLKAEAKYFGFQFAPQRHLFEQYGITEENIQKYEVVRPLRSNNSTGVTGVNYNKNKGKWSARICFKKQEEFLGIFNSKQEAIIARLRKELEYFGAEQAPQRHLFAEYNITPRNDCEVAV